MTSTLATYTNPVYRHSCADPFVLKYCGEYWCYFTGVRPDGRCFGILRSPDLVHWQPVGSALDPLPGGHTCYWAPEVSYINGRFYMYYSVGDEVHMQIRVAVAEQPGGPFADSGHRLTHEEFAIDPHVFVDDDGARYLFYATDYLTYERIGTGTAMDRFLDPFTLAGRPRPVTRARFDWQIYDPQRQEKGGVCWHTVEGPFVLKHDGRYYQMFSGGNWQNATYGVSYATTDNLAIEGEWQQSCDGQQVLPVLRTMPEAGIIGPGHNSVVRGPDNCELFCIYHRWQPASQERVLAIDRQGWQDGRLTIDGPTSTPQPVPRQPTVAGFGGVSAANGRWTAQGHEARLEPQGGQAEAVAPLPAGDFVLEVSLRAAAGSASGGQGPGWLGLALGRDGQERLAFALSYPDNYVEIATSTARQRSPLPAGFDPYAYHLLRIEGQGDEMLLILDDAGVLRRTGPAPDPAGGPHGELRLRTQGQAAAFAGLAVTELSSR